MIIGGGRRIDATIKKEPQLVTSLTMYNEYPDGIIQFEDFATYALERFTGLNFFYKVIKLSHCCIRLKKIDF